METIRLSTWIDAPVERCFQLARSIDLHVASAGAARDEAIGGVTREVTSGLLAEGDTVTLQRRHLLLRRRQVLRIEALRPCFYLREVMITGPFKRFEHDLHFAAMDDGTRMREEIRFSMKWGLLGRMTKRLYTRRHMRRMLLERSALLKQVAETEAWHRYLDGSSEGRTEEAR